MSTFSLFTELAAPTNPNSETTGVSLATEVVCGAGYLLGYRYVRPDLTTSGPLSFAFFSTTTGTADPATILTGVTPSGVGWLQAMLPAAVAYPSGGRFRATGHYPSGKYPYLNNAFAADGIYPAGTSAGPLFAPPSIATAQGQGLYVAGGSIAYPVNMFDETLYYVTPIWSDTDPSTKSGTGSLAVALGTSGSGLSRRAGTTSVATSLATSGVGIARHSGPGALGVSLTATGQGRSQRGGTADLNVQLAVSGTGRSRRSGTVVIDLAMSTGGIGRIPGTLLGRVSVGGVRTTWSTGAMLA